MVNGPISLNASSSQPRDDVAAVADAEPAMGVLDPEGLIPGFLDSFSPTSIQMLVFEHAKQIHLLSFDRQQKKYSMSFHACLAEATRNVVEAFDGLLTTRRFQAAAKDLGVADVYLVTAVHHLARDTALGADQF